jgi:hypothetical protein
MTFDESSRALAAGVPRALGADWGSEYLPSVPVLWLKRYGHLAQRAAFYFLSSDDKLEDLRRPG